MKTTIKHLISIALILASVITVIALISELKLNTKRANEAIEIVQYNESTPIEYSLSAEQMRMAEKSGF